MWIWCRESVQPMQVDSHLPTLAAKYGTPVVAVRCTSRRLGAAVGIPTAIALGFRKPQKDTDTSATERLVAALRPFVADNRLGT